MFFFFFFFGRCLSHRFFSSVFSFFNLNVCLFVCLLACLLDCLAGFFMVLNLDDASKHDFLGENQSYEPRLPWCRVPKASVFCGYEWTLLHKLLTLQKGSEEKEHQKGEQY